MLVKKGLLVACIFCLCACAPQALIPPVASATPTLTASPLPPVTLTPAPSSTPTYTPTPTATPTPTIAPVFHIVKGDDDMFGIAIRYGVSLEALKTANPSVIPHAMGEGLQLLIPITPTPPTAATSSLASPQTTVIEGDTSVYCYRDGFGGAWCLVDYTNESDKPLENVSVLVTIKSSTGDNVQSKSAILPLNLVPAQTRLPLAVYFNAPTPVDFNASATLDFSLPVAEQDARYLAVTLGATDITYSEDRLTAKVTGEVRFDDPARTASSLWVVAIAYDQDDQPVGFRRFEALQPINAEGPLSFNFNVYSLAGVIDRVDLHTEARPILP